MKPLKILVDTNILMSPLTFCILIYLDELGIIQIVLSQSIINEYNFHKLKIPSSELKQYSENFINSYQANIYKHFSSDKIKIKDKGDLHLIEYCRDHNIQNILTFDKNSFYKSQLKKLNLISFHPDIFLFNLISENRIELNILSQKFYLNPVDVSQKLKNAGLIKLSNKLKTLQD